MNSKYPKLHEEWYLLRPIYRCVHKNSFKCMDFYSSRDKYLRIIFFLSKEIKNWERSTQSSMPLPMLPQFLSNHEPSTHLYLYKMHLHKSLYVLPALVHVSYAYVCILRFCWLDTKYKFVVVRFNILETWCIAYIVLSSHSNDFKGHFIVLYSCETFIFLRASVCMWPMF